MGQQSSGARIRKVFRFQSLFLVVFFVMATGIADPITNLLLNLHASQSLDPISLFFFDLFGSNDPARNMRQNDFGQFILMCSYVAGSLTIATWFGWAVCKKINKHLTTRVGDTD